MTISCPTKAELLDCLLGKVGEARTQLVLEHAGECENCSRLLNTLDETADDVLKSLRTDTQEEMQTEAVGVNRMIQQAEMLIPGNPTVEPPIEPKGHLLEGTRVRDYEIVKPIGQGGMGAVFLARHVRLNRNVAIKVLSLGRQRTSEAQKRFEQEMQIVGQLSHPGIVQALDAGEDHGVQYLVMEVINGFDLRHIVRLLGPLPLADACEITCQAANALGYAHSQKLIHRDVKPSNIMLSRDGVAKVMDLGIAKFADQKHALTSTQQALGSLDFMAPEQLQSLAIDGRADVYALGCTLHFLLTGDPPERRRAASLLVSKTPRLDALRHSVPPPLTNMLQQMLQPTAAERCDMGHVVESLKPFCGSANLVQLSSKAQPLVVEEERGTVASQTSEIKAAPAPKGGLLWALAGAAIGILATLAFVTWWMFPTDSLEEFAALPSVSSNMLSVREIPLFQLHNDGIRSLAWCRSTSQLIVGSDDGSISVRNLPNQQLMYVVHRTNRSPIRTIVSADHRKQFFAIDDEKTLLAFDLPSVTLAWSRKDLEAIDVSVDGDRLVVLIDELEAQQLNAETGRTIGPLSTSEMENYWPHRFELEEAIDELSIRGDKVIIAKRFLSSSTWCVADGRLARLIDAQKRDEQHFVYAEHTDPITAMLTFGYEPLVLTGDARGFLRLWQSPNHHRPHMIKECTTRIDSIELTYEMRPKTSSEAKQNRWSVDEFEISPEKLSASNRKIEATVERDGVVHKLEYKLIK